VTKLDQITLPYLILAEGAGDAAFFDHLIAARGIADEFHVTHPSRAPSVTGSGSTRFRQALDAFGILPGFDTLRGIIIVTDCDDDETAAFTNVQDHIRHTAKRHPAPVRPLQKSSGSPPIVVMMIPWIGETGSLEALCVPAAESAFPLVASCADAFQVCSGIDHWPHSKRSQVKLRSIISAAHKKNGDAGLAYIWDEFPACIPLMHSCFDRVANFLSYFGAFINGPRD
jgi:hypothetical protein